MKVRGTLPGLISLFMIFLLFWTAVQAADVKIAIMQASQTMLAASHGAATDELSRS